MSDIKRQNEQQAPISPYVAKDTTEDLIYEFLKDRSPLTEKAYKRDLKAFFKFTRKFFDLPRVQDEGFILLNTRITLSR